MKDTFTTVRDCLNDLEFCSICGNRNKVDLILDDYRLLTTELTNNTITVRYPSFKRDTAVVSINLAKNKITHLHEIAKDVGLSLSITCKRLHFNANYGLVYNDSLNVELYRKWLHFRVEDKKRNKNYTVTSNYETNKTTINIADNIKLLDTIHQNIIDFNDLSDKSVLKTLRALVILV